MKDLIFQQVLPRVSKPARYMGGEYNIIVKDWEASQTKMVWAFPDVYEIGMSHVGGKILYGLVNETSSHLMERVFTPWPDMEAEMRRQSLPLFSLESFRPLKDFDVIGFSLQYELSITNVLNMLDMSDISVWAKDRKESDPLIIGGGPVVFNPEPFAPFFDLFIIGDGEEALLELLDAIEADRGLERDSLLLKLSGIEGVYVPSLYDVYYDDFTGNIKRKALFPQVPLVIRKRAICDLEQAYFPMRPIVPFLNVVHDRAVLEVMRGCQRGCRFCHAGMVYRPVRERSVAALCRQGAGQLAATGYDEISLTSLSTLDYSGIQALVNNLTAEQYRKGISISLPSLRVDCFSIELAEQVQKVRKSTLTLAPEAGTQRLRDIINKNITDEQLYEAVEAAFKAGWTGIKLYFMIGLPEETEEDLAGIIQLLKEVKRIGSRYSRRPVEIRASCAIYVPKPHTPFQWQPQCEEQLLEEKIAFLNKNKIKQVKISTHDGKTSFIEGLLARGDQRLAQMIHRAWQKGCKFDGWTEYFNYDYWQEAIMETNTITEPIMYQSRNFEQSLPWDFIDTGISKAFLAEEARLAVLGVTRPDCRQEGCNNCGVCDNLAVKVLLKEKHQCA